jgi:type I restriction enzyme, S subunit
MMSEWSQYKIKEFCNVVGGGTPSTKKDEYYGGDIAWLTPKDMSIQKSKYIRRGLRNITKLGLSNSSAKLIPKGTVLFTSRAPIGYVGIAEQEVATNQGFKSLVCNDNIAHNEYVYYLLKYKTPQIENIASGSTFKEVSGGVLKDFIVELPPLSTQKKIAQILSALDNKIELNHQMNQTLEDMAQTLFKSWFVNFDPVHAKANAGNDADYDQIAKELGISHEILDLFPDEFEESELGMIPKGWSVASIKDNLDVVLGGTPSRSNDSFWTDGTVSWINSGEVNEFRIIKCSEMITEEAVRRSSTKLMSKKTTVLAITGATLGQVSLLEIDSCANQSVIGLPETLDFNHSFIYPCICNAIKELMSHQTGGAQQHINKGNVEDFKIVIPCRNLLKKYNVIAKPLMDLISNNCFENQILQKTRDTLLPKLLSGELDVSKLELDNATN